MKYLVLFFLFLSVSSCDDKDDNFPCTGLPVAGLNILVKDATTGVVLTDGVTIVASEGNFEESLMLSGTSFEGVYDRAGHYSLTVSKPGYQQSVTDDVAVVSDGCHAVQSTLTIELQPE